MHNKANVKDVYALTPLQEGILFHALFDKQSTAYFEQTCYRIKGRLEATLVEETLGQLVARYDVLRTAFVHKGVKRPLQVVLRKRPADFAFEDISYITDPDEKEAYLREVKQKDIARGFHLTKDTLMRVTCIQLSAATYEFIWSFHHILMDGWCLGILTAEFFEIYNSLCAGRQNRLEPAVPYRRYIEWLEKQDHDAVTKYWGQYLAGYDKPAGIVKTKQSDSGQYRNAEFQFELGPRRTAALQNTAVQCQVTLNTLISAIWGVILAKRNDTRDVVFGGVVSGRPTEIDGVEGIVGLFTNTVPVRVTFGEATRFGDLLREMQQAAIESAPFHHASLAGTQALTSLKQQLLDHIVAFQNLPPVGEAGGTGNDGWTDREGAPIRVAAVESFTQTNYDFTLRVQTGPSLVVEIFYKQQVYEKELIENIEDQFKQVVDQVLADPWACIEALTILSPEAERRMVAEGSRRHVHYPSGETIQQLFEAQVSRTPDAVAVVDQDRAITYRVLNEKANQVAHYLREHFHIRPDDLVALALHRSERMIIAILGILKAGAAYVPIDPEYPAARIGYVLADAPVRAILLDDGRLEETVPMPHVPKGYFSAQGTLADGYAKANPGIINAPADLAYIIYTSGSTGNPKGTMVEHRNVVRLLFNDSFQFDFGPRDTWTLCHSVCFDFSVWEMFGALLYGGRLVIVSKALAQSPAGFAGLLASEGVTVLNQVPSMFKNVSAEMLARESNYRLALRYVVFGGEALNPASLKAWHQRFGQAALINMYGITETTVHVTFKRIGPREIESGSSNIGQPIPTLSVYIMNGKGRLMPMGTVGEIVVGGEGVTRGYLGRPALTEERFKVNPYNPGERIYCSGDLGVQLPGGDIIYLGRKDAQVKVRGHRIEVAEIENKLLQWNDIDDALVVADHDKEGNTRLIAYYVGRKALNANDLHAYLKEQLPAYMIPAYFVPLDAFPLTGNHKIDRKALPDPESYAVRDAEPALPVTELEAKVLAVWQRVLGKETLGGQDHFFAVGGDSIKAIRLVSALNENDDWQVEVKDVFTFPTVTALAAYIGKETGFRRRKKEIAQAAAEIAALRERMLQTSELAGKLPADWEDFYPMSDIQTGMLFHSLLNPTAGVYHDQMYYQVQDNTFRFEVLQVALGQMIRKHAILRTSFRTAEFPLPMQVVHAPAPDAAPLAYEDIRHLDAGQQEAYLKAYARLDLARPLDLTAPGLWRMRVFRVAEADYGIFFTCHHAIIDGWSDASLMVELGNAYYALKADPDFKLQPLKAAYKDYIIDQYRYKQGSAAAAAGYWKNLLTDYVRTSLPFGKVPEPGSAAQMQHVFDLDEDLNQALLRLAERVSVRDACLAAFVYTLKITAGADDAVIGLVSSARPEMEDGDKVLGCFLNTVPFRVQTPPNASADELLRIVSRRSAEIKQYDKLSFVEILKAIGEEKTLANPVYDVQYNFVDFHINRNLHQELVIRESNVEGQVKTNVGFDFVVSNKEGRITIAIKTLAGLYTPAELKRLEGFYVRTVRQLATGGAARLSAEMILGGEAELLLNQSPNPVFPAVSAGAGTIAGLFEAQAARTPQAAAVRYEGRCFTYRELNERANQLAHYLREHHAVGAGDQVGLFMPRSEWMIVGLLGILKAGATYVPIDPGSPGERVRFTLEDAAVKLVVMEDNDPHSRFHVMGFSQVCLRADRPGIEACSNANPATVAGAGNGVYVIYTSGSTGRPKGVLISNASLANYVAWFNGTFAIGPGDSTLLLSSIAFDLGYSSLWPALLSGSTLHLLKERQYLNLEELFLALTDGKISFLKLTPSHFNLLVNHPDFEKEVHRLQLRLIVLGGEKPSIQDLEKYFHYRPETQFVNHYGPTETTIGTVARPLSYHDLEAFRAAPSIGWPISNAQAYVLSPQQSLLAIGAVGELCIGGPGVGEGYVNRPELTADKFIDNPFGPGRLYRTGDLARWLPQGELEFVGRRDGQLKLRGYRVEPSEVAYWLGRQAGVDTAAVAVQQLGESKCLVGYYCSVEGVSPAQLRSALLECLPEYMVPTFLVPLAQLPLTPNGKIDLKALPPVAVAGPGPLARPAANAGEQLLVEVWQGVLGRAGIGTQEEFFALGGDSIKAIQICSRLYKQGYKLEVRHLFTHPTIEQLATLLEKSQQHSPQQAVSGPVALSPIQQRFFASAYQQAHHYNQALVIKARHGFEARGVQAVLDKLLEHHDALRMCYLPLQSPSLPAGGPPLVQQLNQPVGQPAALRVYEWGHQDWPARQQWQQFEQQADELQAGLDLAQGRLLQAGLFHLPGEDHLLIVIHHLVVDGVSWRILLEDFDSLYGQWQQGRPLELAPKTDSYQRWTEQLQAYAHGPVLQQEQAYWQQVVQRLEVVQRLAESSAVGPASRPAGGEPVSASFRLSQTQTSQLLTQAHRAYNTHINDLLLTALVVALAGPQPGAWVAISLEGHGREELDQPVDVSRTVGWFTSLYPVVLPVVAGGPLAAQLKAVKETLRAVPGKGLGYGLLRYLRGSLGQTSHQPQVCFNYLGQFDAELQADSFGPSQAPSGRARSPLQHREHPLEVTGMVVDHQLLLTITYCSWQYRSEAMEQLMAAYQQTLSELIAHCVAKPRRSFTPSDVGMNQWSIADIDRLNDQYAIEDIYPLSPMQEGMLFSSLFNKASRANFGQWSFRLEGRVSVAYIREGYLRVIDRHKTLRTVFVHHQLSRPVQLVVKNQEDFTYTDISTMAEDQQSGWLAACKEADKQRGFDLSDSKPLMRIALVKLRDDCFELIWSYHHILKDGWSSGVIMADFYEIYGHLIQGRPVAMAPPVSFRRYTEWLEKQKTEEAREYWKNYLKDYRNVIRTGKTRQPETGGSGYEQASAEIVLGAETVRQIKDLTAGARVTMNTFMQAAWALWLAEHNQVDDVVFGAVVSGRPAEIKDVEGLVGLFINTVPLRIRWDGQTRFMELLQTVQREAIDSQKYHFCSLAETQTLSELKRNLVSHVLVFENQPESSHLKELFEKNDYGFRVAAIDAAVQEEYSFNIVVYTAEGIRIELKYNRQVYAEEEMLAVKEGLQAIIAQVLAEPHALVAAVHGRRAGDPAGPNNGPRKIKIERRARNADAPHAAPPVTEYFLPEPEPKDTPLG